METILTLTMNPCIDKSSGVERVVPDRKLRCGPPRFEPGGGGINVSRAIKKLGGESLALFPAGGPTGEMLAVLLDQEGVAHYRVEIEGWTRENLMIYDESAEQQFRFGMPGPEVGEWETCLQALKDVRPNPAYIVASGSLPSGVPEDLYARVAGLAKEMNCRMILDTSGPPLSRALREGVYMIKPNLRELKGLAKGELDDEKRQEGLARELVRNGHSEVVMISMGAGGALVVWADGCERLRAPTVNIRSKVGAGDSTVAGVVSGLARNWALLDAVRFGIAAGAAAVMTPGSELCRRDDTERLYERISATSSSS